MLNLPAADAGIWRAVEKVDAASVDECAFRCVDCLIPFLRDAINNAILLVFMYDRLGRNLNETPFIAEWFTKKGIHVWSVYEGEIIDGVDAERMLDYIRFWQTDEAQKL